MKNARSLALVLAALAAPLFSQTARADEDVSFEYFEEALSPYGEWIEVADYGLCWRPTGVAEDWAPYTDGYWAYTDAGWTWVSYEEWGGIAYHYGRWIHLVDDGWVWVPDYVWGPAWVSWRSSDDYVGWAPLPPEARWEENTGFSTWVDTSYDIGPGSYRFCHTRDFGAPVLAPICVPPEENVVIIQNTVNVTNITYNNFSSVVFCGGPSFGDINRHVRRPIPSLKLLCETREERGDHGRHRPQVIRGNQLAVYAPKVARPADLKALPIRPQRVVGAEKVNRGWSRVPDLAVQQQIKQRLQNQTAGLNPRTAPARPVRPADLSAVPRKAEPNAPTPNAVVRGREGDSRNPARPPVLSRPGDPQRPVVGNRPVLPRAPGVATPAPVAARERPTQDRPGTDPRRVPTQPFNNPPPPVAERLARPPQVAVPDQNARAAEIERARIQRQQAQAVERPEQRPRVAESPQQDAQENARRAAVARQQQQQQDAAKRVEEERSRAQQQQAELRAAQERSNRVQRPPVTAPDPQQEARRQQAMQQQQEARRQQAMQQQQDARRQQAAQQQQQEAAAQRANQARQQQESVQRANEARRQQAQQMEQRQQAVQRANEMRNQQAQQADAMRQRQEAVQRANEARQQQVRQAQQAAQPQQAAPSQPSRQRGDGDDEKRKHRDGR